MRDLLELLKCLLHIAGYLILFWWIFYGWPKESCKSTSETLGYKYEFSLTVGCVFIDNNGNKIIGSQLRYNKDI